MYSPFIDEKGQPLSLNKVTYNHLEQLKECDEGHHLEFKSKLEDDWRAQLAKEIASFANCEGGWLIVGIDDKSKEISPIPKVDYSQKIGKIVARISPKPEFETKFLSMPDNESMGVLLVYVYEGKYAPYICNGSIYVRSGSSKEPIKPAERGHVEYLLARSKAFQGEINDFFHREQLFSRDYANSEQNKYPIINIYIKNISAKNDISLYTYEARDELIDFIRCQNNDFMRIEYSMDSVVFSQDNALLSNISSVFELFYDWSCKIHVPVVSVSDWKMSELTSFFESIGISQFASGLINVVNGTPIFSTVMVYLKLFSLTANQYSLKENDYAICVEVENLAKTTLTFAGKKYKDYVHGYGVPYPQRNHEKSDIFYLKDHPNISFQNLVFDLINDFLAPAFGYRSDSIQGICHASFAEYRN